MATKLPAVHPGEVLFEEFLEPLGLSQYRLAKDISVPPRRINEIVHGKRAVTADTGSDTLVVAVTAVVAVLLVAASWRRMRRPSPTLQTQQHLS